MVRVAAAVLVVLGACTTSPRRAPRPSPAASPSPIPPPVWTSPTGLASVQLMEIDLGPPPAHCDPEEPCGELSITLEHTCRVHGRSGRDFDVTVPADVCSSLLTWIEREIAPRMAEYPCPPIHDVRVRVELTRAAADGGQRSQLAHAAGCIGEAPWQELFDRLRALRPPALRR